MSVKHLSASPHLELVPSPHSIPPEQDVQTGQSIDPEGDSRSRCTLLVVMSPIVGVAAIEGVC